jgi:cysteine desulfurase/selenocysteine lyase
VSAVDVARVRADFPILAERVNGRPLVYLDNAATTQKPAAVLRAVASYYEHTNANVHRAIHTLGERATEAYEASRARVARFIHAPEPATVVFVRNASEALNLVAYAWGSRLRAGDEIVLTPMEHHSNLIPWQLLARRSGAVLRFIPLQEDGELDLERAPIGARTRIVSVTHASNVLGTLVPAARLAAMAHAAGAVFVLDAAQSVPHLPVDVQALDCDFLAFSGHKVYGPMGIGVLYGKRALLEEMEPFLGGGEMILEVHLDRATWNDVPWKFEAGTPNVGGAVGLAAALDYLDGLGVAEVASHERRLTEAALGVLADLPGVTVYGPRAERGALVSFSVEGIHPHDLSQVLDQEGVAIRAGHHCCQPLMRQLGVAATARASFACYNTLEEVEALGAAVRKAQEFFSRVMR